MQFGRNEILIGVAVLAVALLIVVPFLLSNGKGDKREEIARNVEEIRQAELQYADAFGGFVSAEDSPQAFDRVGPEPVPWKASEGFRKLSWAPQSKEVYGTYRVTVSREDFTVTGRSDIDGDGVPAEFTATRESPATMTTASGVY